jgi:hypothetical protein
MGGHVSTINCVICGKPHQLIDTSKTQADKCAGYVSNDGHFFDTLYCGYGSHYDTLTLRIWGIKLPHNKPICDGCVMKVIKDGYAHFFSYSYASPKDVAKMATLCAKHARHML